MKHFGQYFVSVDGLLTEKFYGIAKHRRSNMRVTRGHLDRGVAKKLLNRPHLNALSDQLRSESVSENMPTNEPQPHALTDTSNGIPGDAV